MDIVHQSICRLCAESVNQFLRIYDDEGYKLSIGIKINKYLQIQVDEKDSLPKTICWNCYTKLEQFSNFVLNSQHVQITLSRKIYDSYTDESSMKEENLFPQSSLFQQADDIIHFDSQQVNRSSNETNAFHCANLVMPSGSSSCFFNNETSDCLYEETNDLVSTTNSDCQPCTVKKSCINEECDYVSSDSTKPSLIERPKKTYPKRILLPDTKRKKLANTKDCNLEVYNEDNADLLRQKYFGDMSWVCTECEANFETFKALRLHFESSHFQPPQYLCPYCYKVYSAYQGFVTHLKSYQCFTEFSCSLCSKTFSSKQKLNLHLQTHSDKREFQCKICGKSFRSRSNLCSHIQAHTKREYACIECDKSFSTKANLLTHKKIHAGQRNFVCDLCGKGFIQKGNLTAHMLTHSDKKPFTCDLCHKEFKTKMLLRKHESVHSGEKPHVCEFCRRTFRERGTLKEHYRIHTGAMPFSCEFCGKAFRFKGVLTTHRRQHTGERPYSCSDCGHYFTNWPNYNKHMKRRHGIDKSKTSQMKSDTVSQAVQEIIENSRIMNNDNNTPIDIALEGALESVSVDSSDPTNLFNETTNDTELSPFLINHHHQSFNCDTSAINHQQTSILGSYYNISSPLHVNSNSSMLDIMSGPLHRNFVV